MNAIQIHALIQAAQSVCQTVGGSNEKATRIAHNLALGELQKALAAVTENPLPNLLIAINVSDQFLRDLLCVCCEGGSTYWAYFTPIKNFKGEHGPEWQKVRVSDVEGDEEETQFVIDIPELREGVRRLIAREFNRPESHAQCAAGYSTEIFQAALTNDCGQIDAGVADMVLQMACFGHIVYG